MSVENNSSTSEPRDENGLMERAKEKFPIGAIYFGHQSCGGSSYPIGWAQITNVGKKKVTLRYLKASAVRTITSYAGPADSSQTKEYELVLPATAKSEKVCFSWGPYVYDAEDDRQGILNPHDIFISRAGYGSMMSDNWERIFPSTDNSNKFVTKQEFQRYG